jgi:hypothetical protein
MRDLLAWVAFGAGIWLIDSAIKGQGPLTTLGTLLSGQTAIDPNTPTNNSTGVSTGQAVTGSTNGTTVKQQNPQGATGGAV